MLNKIIGLFLITPVIVYVIVVFRATNNDWPISYAATRLKMYWSVAWFLELFGLGLYFLFK